MDKKQTYKATSYYHKFRIRTLEHQNTELINKVLEERRMNKLLWIALSIMSGLSFVQSLVLLNG